MPEEQSKPDRKRTDRVGAIVAAFVVLCAIIRATTSASAIAQQRPATDDEKRKAFWDMAANERDMRRDAVHDFPTDAWSQDDAFHNSEFKKAREWGDKHGVRLMDVLIAMDEGMHAGWPRPRNTFLSPTVPPCRPRPIY
ncbi:MAG: hypothetical protein ACRELY_08960 [Polyangiaceae bacterium]